MVCHVNIGNLFFYIFQPHHRDLDTADSEYHLSPRDGGKMVDPSPVLVYEGDKKGPDTEKNAVDRDKSIEGDKS
jgi:hypothetical protein